ncbi:MAG: elongation factor P-like protein YeiP [Gammaproteobacteria bacterium]
MKANELKRGLVFEMDGKNIIVKQVQVQSPSSRSGSTLYKVRGHDVSSGQKYERSFKGDESVTQVDLSRCAVQLLFRDSTGCTFMDNESYEQYVIPEGTIEDELAFMVDGMEGITALISEGQLLGLELPATVVLVIEECAPSMKAASSSARTKPATLNTGLIVQVPEYITPGESIKVNTDTREFIARA